MPTHFDRGELVYRLGLTEEESPCEWSTQDCVDETVQLILHSKSGRDLHRSANRSQVTCSAYYQGLWESPRNMMHCCLPVCVLACDQKAGLIEDGHASRTTPTIASVLRAALRGC